MQPNKIQKNILISIFFTIFLDLIGYGMFMPILPLLARSFRASDSQIAMLGTWFAFATLVSGVFLGYFSDIIGRKKVLIASIALSCMAQILTGFANSYIFLVVTKILAGFAAGNIATAQACISDITSSQDRGRHMVTIGLAFGGGFTVGPLLGTGIILSIDKLQLLQGNYILGIAFCAAILNIGNLIFVVFKLPETHIKFANVVIKGMIEKNKVGDLSESKKEQTKSTFSKALKLAIQNKSYCILCTVLFLLMISFSGIETLMPLILKDAYFFSEINVYKSYIFIGVLSLIANFFIVRNLIKRVGEALSLKIGLSLLVMSFFAIPICAPHPHFFFLSMSAMCLGIAIANPSLNALISLSISSKWQGFGFGMAQTIVSFAKILGPALIGFAYQHGLGLDAFLKEKSLYLSGIILLIGLILSTGWIKSARKSI
ncbi:MFS transporter [Silvanigrella aquatica]|uniref:Major facilitator superfamily (MFS) profile domain-containing protein n=1 Tax=Silvanigrella aquatica TaxID=1915309 RepID=A0A1L4D0M1_9BACT|nr:MFS transporter [Silvanigrella aquatica]APJ03763.1 hypothetical protein AXG55_07530 [Silvanigrella aquatica]